MHVLAKQKKGVVQYDKQMGSIETHSALKVSFVLLHKLSERGISCSINHLQGLLYVLQGRYLLEEDRPLFVGAVYKQAHGPGIPSVRTYFSKVHGDILSGLSGRTNLEKRTGTTGKRRIQSDFVRLRVVTPAFSAYHEKAKRNQAIKLMR